MLTAEDLANKESALYLQFCRNASRHDVHEQEWKLLAHTIFYHLQEVRVTGVIREVPPILYTWLDFTDKNEDEYDSSREMASNS